MQSRSATRAPLSSKTRTTSACPLDAASRRGVQSPPGSAACTSAPAACNALTTSVFPARAISSHPRSVQCERANTLSSEAPKPQRSHQGIVGVPTPREHVQRRDVAPKSVPALAAERSGVQPPSSVVLGFALHPSRYCAICPCSASFSYPTCATGHGHDKSTLLHTAAMEDSLGKGDGGKCGWTKVLGGARVPPRAAAQGAAQQRSPNAARLNQTY